MKKIWLMLLMIGSICAFNACSDDDDAPAPVCPVSGVNVPKTAEIGKEINVTGTGFAQSAQLYLKDAAAKETKVEEATFTTSGATFKVPMVLTAGNYTLVLKQEGTWEIGEITLTAASLPVLDLELPAEGWIGKKVTIGGSGFNETSKLYLEDANSTRAELVISDRSNGLVAKIPASQTAGTYKIILTQDGGEWVLKADFKVVVAPMIKRLVKVSTLMNITTSDDLTAELREILESAGLLGSQTISSGSLVFDPETGKLTAYKSLNMDGSESVTVTFNETDHQLSGTNVDGSSFVLTLEDGRVIRSTIEYSNGRSGEYNWTYNAETGYAQGLYAVSSGKAYRVYNFKNGNFVSMGAEASDMFKYGDSDLKHNPYGIDVALFLTLEGEDDAQRFATMLGLNGKKSVNLPNMIVVDGGETSLTYQYDEAGYVTSVSYLSGEMPMDVGELTGGGEQLITLSMSNTYEFEYEVVDYE